MNPHPDSERPVVAPFVPRPRAADDQGYVHAAFAALPTPAAVVDAAGRVVAVNPAWQRLCPWGKATEVGTDLCAHWREAGGERLVVDALCAVLRSRTTFDVEVGLPGTPRRRAVLQMTAAELDDGSAGAVVVVLDITSRHLREQQLLFQATHDALTGLANRAALYRAAEDAIEAQRRHGTPYALLYLDLDGFKSVNDTYGHHCGDELLRQVAARWRPVVRSPDVLARVGGDEFVALVHYSRDADAAARVAGRLQSALAEPFTIDGVTVRVSVSIGVALPSADLLPGEAVALADEAMYQGRQERRARVQRCS